MMRWGHSLRVVAPNGISGRFFPGTSFPQLSAPPREILFFLLEGSRDPRRRADGWHLPGIGITRRGGGAEIVNDAVGPFLDSGRPKVD